MISGPVGLALARQQVVIDLAKKRMQFDVAPFAAQLQVFNDRLAERIRPIVAQFLDTNEVLDARIAAQTSFDPRTDREWRHQLLPSNLVDLDPDELNAVAAVSLEDGIPVAWVPSVGIVRKLLGAADRSEKDGHPSRTRSRDPGRVRGCHDRGRRQLRRTLPRSDRCAPRRLHRAGPVTCSERLSNAREAAKNGGRGEIDDVSIHELSDNLTLRPVVQALARWFPGDSGQFPELFSRHVTAHAIGEDQATGPAKALVAVMLATSLLCEFCTDEPVDKMSSTA